LYIKLTIIVQNNVSQFIYLFFYFYFFHAKVYVYEMSQLLALFNVFFKIFIHIEYLKKHITSIKIKIIRSYMFQSPYDHHQGVF